MIENKARTGDLPNIVLVGFMAAGKSSIGRRLAQELGWAFYDTDQEVERMTGLQIKDIFQVYGEERFRMEESKIVHQLAGMSPCVIATGGGTLQQPENAKRLQDLGIMIHLYSPLEIALQRMERKEDRPLANQPLIALEKLWQQRLVLYNQAQLTIDTSVHKIDEIVEEILLYVKGAFS